MADNKKYYYLKLKDNFFDSDAMLLLESQPDGYVYSNILLKLFLKSLKHDGRLMFNDRIPYNASMLANVVRHSVGDVEKALKLFKDLELIEMLDTGAIYMSDIQEFIGKSSTEADRKRAYRSKIEAEKVSSGQMSIECPDKSTPEIRDKRLDNIYSSNKNSIESDFEKLWKLYPKKTLKKEALSSYKKAIKQGVTNKQIQDGIIAYKKLLAVNTWQKPMDGGRWFKKERWTDELVIDSNEEASTSIQSEKSYEEVMREMMN